MASFSNFKSTVIAAAQSAAGTTPGVSIYAARSSLPTSGNSQGDQAYVTDNNRLYIWNGSGWYNVALLNVAPAISSVLDSDGGTTPFALSTEGATTRITITAADSDGDPITYEYSADSDFSGLATISQDSSVFTITPFSEDSATTESGTITFTATDGVNVASSGVQTFTLTFIATLADPTNISINTSTDGLSSTTAGYPGFLYSWDTVNNKLLSQDWGSGYVMRWDLTDGTTPSFNSEFDVSSAGTSFESMHVNSGFLILGKWVNYAGVYNLSNDAFVGSYGLGTTRKISTYDGANYILTGDTVGNVRKYPFNTSTGVITTTSTQLYDGPKNEQMCMMRYMHDLSASLGNDYWWVSSLATANPGYHAIISCTNDGSSAFTQHSTDTSTSNFVSNLGAQQVVYDELTGTCIVGGSGNNDFYVWYHDTNSTTIQYKGSYQTSGSSVTFLHASSGYLYAATSSGALFEVWKINADHSLTLQDTVATSETVALTGLPLSGSGRDQYRPGGWGMFLNNTFIFADDNGTRFQWIS